MYICLMCTDTRSIPRCSCHRWARRCLQLDDVLRNRKRMSELFVNCVKTSFNRSHYCIQRVRPLEEELIESITTFTRQHYVLRYEAALCGASTCSIDAWRKPPPLQEGLLLRLLDAIELPGLSAEPKTLLATLVF